MRKTACRIVGWTTLVLAAGVGGCGRHELVFKSEPDNGVRITGARGSPLVRIHTDTTLQADQEFPFRLKGQIVDCKGVAGNYPGQVPYPGEPGSGDHVKLTVHNSEPWLDFSSGYGFAYIYRTFLIPRTRRIAGGMTGGGQLSPTYYTGGCIVASDKANDYVFFFHVDGVSNQSPSMLVEHQLQSGGSVTLMPGQFCVVTDAAVGPAQNISGTADMKAIEILKQARLDAQINGEPLPPNAP